MYFRPFLVIQLLAFLTAQIWAHLQLRKFGMEFISKLQALAASGYIPIPLPHEMSDYVHVTSVAKAGSFFTFTVGFALGIVAFGGYFCLNRYKSSLPIRLGWTVIISALFSLPLGISILTSLLLIAFFGWTHLAMKTQEAPFRKVSLLSMIPLLVIPAFYGTQDFLFVRDELLERSWGRKVVSSYYRYSPLAAEFITPPTERTQITVWTATSLGKTQKSWLLRKGIYTISTQEGADLIVVGEVGTGPAVVNAIMEDNPGRGIKRLRGMIRLSIFIAAPAVIMLFVILITNRLLSLSKYSWIILIVCIACISALLIYKSPSKGAWESTGTLPGEKVEDIRRWVYSEKKTGGLRARQNFIGHLGSSNPAVRLWAATALAHLPSKDNVEVLMNLVSSDPITIVRCKAIFALSHQRDMRVIPFLVSRLKGEEDWYVKHYLIGGLRRLGWTG